MLQLRTRQFRKKLNPRAAAATTLVMIESETASSLSARCRAPRREDEPGQGEKRAEPPRHLPVGERSDRRFAAGIAEGE